MTRWTAAQLPSYDGRTAVVTGANSGIGWHTAAALAAHGAQVTLACRNEEKAEQAAAKIRSRKGVDVGVEQLDLSSLASVDAFVARWSAPLDLLVNNAGVMTPPHWTATADGFELQLGTNHLGHFALTGLLIDLVLAAPAPRVVTVSSMVALIGRIHLQDLQLEHRYGAWKAYAQSKLANLLFAFELERRSRANGRNLVSVAAHPGSVRTNLQTTGRQYGRASDRTARNALSTMMRIPGVSQPADKGALPSLYAATSPEAQPGGYYGPSRLDMTGPPGRAPIPPQARNERVARALWEASEQLTGVHWSASLPKS
jgi:NAD(P)-dependent dehydrogenase (short-subunit alcohol dehydrogenase family)